MDGLYALGWRKSIFFVDDNFIGNKKHIKTEVLPALIEWRKGKTGMPFSTEASINLADDPELIRLMVQAGFDTVFADIETPNEDSLAECSKNQNKGRDLVESVKQLQRAGLQVQGGFIVGFDNDSPSIFRQQINFIQKSGIVTAMVGLLQAPLRTRLYERMQKEGRLVHKFSGDNVDGSTNIIPKMGLEPLGEGYHEILSHIYAPRFYYERVLTFLREYQPPEVRMHLEPQYILALWRSIYHLGIRGVERVHYWRLFFWTLFFISRIRAASPATTILVDEAYHEYVDDPSYRTAVPMAAEDPCVIVSRTFSKVYGMAGIRLGYAVAHPATIRRLSAWRLGASVNQLVLAAAGAVVGDAAHIAREQAANRDAKAFTRAFFERAGYSVGASETNFLMVDLRRDPQPVRVACRENGVAVGRPFPPLTNWLRVSIGTMDEMRRATEVFGRVLG